MRAEHIFGAALIATGLFALYPRVELPLGTLREPGAGFFPVVVAVALVLFAALSLVKGTSEMDRSEAEPGGLVRVSILTATVVAYAWFLPTIGFVLCTAVFLAVVLRLGKVGYILTIISSAGGATACYLLFTRLGMPLPSGLLGF